MDGSERSNLRYARDAAVRRRLGLPQATTRRAPMEGDKTKRWNAAEIEAAVRRLTGGKKVSRGEYKRIRALHGPEFPHPDTVATRCPDLFA